MREDKRTKKTKRKIKDSFLTLLETKSFDQISVSDIAEVCQMNRVTFYTHYQDKYELVDDIISDIKVTINGTLTTSFSFVHTEKENIKNACYKLIEVLYEMSLQHEKLVRRLNEESNSTIVYMLQSNMVNYVSDLLSHLATKKPLKYSPRKIAIFIVSGANQIIIDWFHSRTNETGEDLLNGFKKLINDVLDSNLLFIY